jgi:DNA-binding MarR family transcriptional regulator
MGGHLLRRSQQVHTQLWSGEFPGDLTSPQYGVLAVLAARPGIDQRQLGALVSLDKSSVADVVARLVARMWIVRTRDPGDARRNLLSLAPAAAIAFEHLVPRSRRVQDGLLAPLRDEDRTVFRDRLRAVSRLDLGNYVEGEPGPDFTLHIDVPGHLIRRAQQVHTAIWADVFGRELTGPQYAAMHVVFQWPGVNQRTLGERAALDKSTAADIVTRLERRGSLVRERDVHDGRGRLLRLTPEADAAMGELAVRVEEVQRTLLLPLPREERPAFLAALARVAYLGEVPALLR